MRKFKFRLDKKTDKKIISMAWPSIMEQILEMMVGMVSIIFMGRIGTDAVAAVRMVNMLMGFLQTVFFGLNKWMRIGMLAVMIGTFFDFASKSVMYLIRMNKGEWKYLKV